MEVLDPLAPFLDFGPAKAVALTRTQKVVAARMTHSWTTIPHVTHHDDVDVTALEARRASAAPGAKVTALAYLIKAVARALRDWPRFNASLSSDGKAVVFKDYVHIGIAVEILGGLLVPVLRDCDTRPLLELATELRAQSEAARTSGLPYDKMVGGCFTISALGGIGGTSFTPIVNAPEVAILGVCRTTTKPVWDGEAFQPRQMMPLSLSYDHRVINGADAARFCRDIDAYLQDPEALE